MYIDNLCEWKFHGPSGQPASLFSYHSCEDLFFPICCKNSCSWTLCALIFLLLHCTSKEECIFSVIIFQVTEDDSGPSSTVFSNLNQINFLDIFPCVFCSMQTSGILKDKQLSGFQYLHYLFQKVMMIFN